ncbi:MAG: methyltransferase domain-containing protein [Phycisphaerae bacterium]|nr:methyltransferase domain-containing protein [Phycisphaerae bacterium]
MSSLNLIHESVQDYYGRVLGGTRDLKTSACCTGESMPAHVRALLPRIKPEIRERFYGCGSPIPPAIEGCTVLDLGCGTGRDSYICSALVGSKGQVLGLDMTPEQLDIARRHQQSQAERFGLPEPNTTFMQGYLEDLAAAGIGDESVDVTISNCVLNLAPNKQRVFDEIYRVLKPGGELLFSDVFADRRLPQEWMDDPVLLGECLAGAMYFEDFRRMMVRRGIPDVRVVHRRPMTLGNAAIEEKVGPVRFESVTVRIFKLADLEDQQEDYGHIATYLGSMSHASGGFALDQNHVFPAGKPTPVSGNTAAILTATRYSKHFKVRGDRSRHFGLFAAAGATPGSTAAPSCC